MITLLFTLFSVAVAALGNEEYVTVGAVQNCFGN